MPGRLVYLSFSLIFILSSWQITAQEATRKQLHVLQTTRLNFGKARDAIGADIGGGEHWKPLFFAVDSEGNIHIPDFYKNRIAVFKPQGKLLKAKACSEGLSPRMNYFGLNPLGCYITVSDYYLYYLNEMAHLTWKKELGFGVIPEFVYANNTGLYLVLSIGDKRALVFDYSSSRPLGRLGLKGAEDGIPFVMTSVGYYFTPRLGQMRKLEGIAPSAFQAADDAALVAVDTVNRSLWKKTMGQSETFYVFSAAGKLLNQATLTFPSAGEGSGFWTGTREQNGQFIIYKNYFYNDYMEVVAYHWQ